MVTKHREAKSFLDKWIPSSCPSAGVRPEKLAFRVPGTRILWKPPQPSGPSTACLPALSREAPASTLPWAQHGEKAGAILPLEELLPASPPGAVPMPGRVVTLLGCSVSRHCSGHRRDRVSKAHGPAHHVGHVPGEGVGVQAQHGKVSATAPCTRNVSTQGRRGRGSGRLGGQERPLR